ncbi:hypothetical protein BDN72DRAFT_840949, partial [Pluteus cervinus]
MVFIYSLKSWISHIPPSNSITPTSTLNTPLPVDYQSPPRYSLVPWVRRMLLKTGRARTARIAPVRGLWTWIARCLLGRSS